MKDKKKKEKKKLLKPPQMLNATETLDLLNKQWLNTEDIMKIAFIGQSKAREITKDLTKIVEDKGYRLPRGLFPTQIVQEYFGININYLKKIERG